jgi:hypothetical protein
LCRWTPALNCERFVSPRLLPRYLIDAEKVLTEASVLNPKIDPSNAPLPEELFFDVGQNPKIGSSVSNTQHTQIYLSNLKVGIKPVPCGHRIPGAMWRQPSGLMPLRAVNMACTIRLVPASCSVSAGNGRLASTAVVLLLLYVRCNARRRAPYRTIRSTTCA